MKARSKKKKIELLKAIISGEQPIESIIEGPDVFEVWRQDRFNDKEYFIHGDERIHRDELRKRIDECTNPRKTFITMVYEGKPVEVKDGVDLTLDLSK